MRLTRALTAATAVALLAPAVASAVDYPQPTDPGKPKPRPGGSATLKVCKRGCKYKNIQKAIDAARAGDTIRVAAGTYKPTKSIGFSVTGHAKDAIRIIGDPKKPGKVFIDSRGKQNGFIINGSDDVTVNGFATKGYSGNGFFVVNADGYTFTHLIAQGNGTYGVYAFNTKGGTISNSEAYYNNDSGFYIGQTPPQVKPKRSVATNLSAWGNVLGWSGTNMRYVTITKSDFFNNGVGIVPNALSSEKYPPPVTNVITRNRIFWNNYNYYGGAPFKLRKEASGLGGYPIGTGILLFGGQDHQITNNQIFGNWLVGAGLVQQFTLPGDADKLEQEAATKTGAAKAKLLAQAKEIREAAVLRKNRISGNAFGLNGTDLNGRGLFYDGSGTENCFSGNTGLGADQPNVPAANPAVFPSCPGPAQNTEDASALIEAAGWLASPTDTDAQKAAKVPTTWKQHPHASGIKVGGKTVTPLVNYKK